MDDLPLFVFGTLRRGEPNHHVLAGRYDRCLAATLKGFRREMATHGFPSIRLWPGEQVDGELFFLSAARRDETLRDCDRLEDLPPGKLAGDFYRRAQVCVTTAEGDFTAWAYVDPATPVDGENRVL